MNEVNTHPYEALTPDVVLDAVDSLGFVTDGRLLALNSYENRVYQVGIEDAQPVVAKFYRPGRWTDAQILEEHAFALELAGQEIPVIAPMKRNGTTLFVHSGFRFALFPRRGGRAPELDNEEHLEWLGRFIGRIHAVGGARRFEHRLKLSIATAEESLGFLLASDFLPDYLRENFANAARLVLDAATADFEAVMPANIRLHGDCHPGNILWTDAGPHFVDLDDCLAGPAMQDIWMLLSGSRSERTRQLRVFLDGYRQFRDFDEAETGLIEALRALRMINFMAWLARRWDDPAFPPAFPWFGSPRYWEDQLHSLREQLDALREPPLSLRPGG